MNTFISYDGLPISLGGAHKISSKPPEIIYEKIKLFLDTYTNCKSAFSIYLTSDKSNILKILKYSGIFGIPDFKIDNFIANRQRLFSWTISNKKISKAIQLISDNEEITLSILWKFKFVQLADKKILSGQDAIPIIDQRLSNSQIYLRLSKNTSTISTWFAFPFYNLSEENLEYIEGIKKILPFKFSNKSWRIWELSKKDKWISKVLEINGS